MKYFPLSKELEQEILCAIMSGVASSDAVTAEELSAHGKAVFRAIALLREQTPAGPLAPRAVLLAATDVLGASRGEIQNYLASLAPTGVSGVAEILQKVRDKQALVELINAAGKQLQEGSLDLRILLPLLSREGGSPLETVADRIEGGLPDPPQGLAIKSLPRLTHESGGIYGMWVIGGMPKVGKSTLAWQIALDVGQALPVLFYDYENGFAVLMDHTASIYKGDLDAIRSATQNIYYGDSVRTLDRDLASVPSPALVVVDSVQKLPSSIEHKRQGLDRWMHRFEALKKRGYSILLVSELSRAYYGSDAYIGGYKETGEIEYTADTGLQLIGDRDGVAELHVVANRHRRFRGFLTNLVRKRDWLWKEQEPHEG